MNHRSAHRHPGKTKLASLATFVAVLALASGGAAMAATGYAHLLRTAKHLAPAPTPTNTPAAHYWQPPGCVFPPTNAFPQHQ